MVTATALKLTVTTGQFRPKYHGHFPPEQVVTLFRNQVVNISETSIHSINQINHLLMIKVPNRNFIINLVFVIGITGAPTVSVPEGLKDFIVASIQND
ncbi:hypothetical protein [Sphingobacterium sp.]|uniref:hypothetical protein n=1 Tax=Sphingobacterium sp. TaxID=341027 RepID=UPI0031DE914A